MKEVTLLGRGPTRFLEIPPGEVWGLNAGYLYCNRLSRIFAMHDPRFHTGEFEAAGDLEEMKRLEIPVVDLKSYPLFEVMKEFGTSYFQSSFAYMMALAIYEGYERINIMGFDMLPQDKAHIHARPNCDYWVGVAVGRGIHVNKPHQSCICKPEPGCEGLYGYDFTPLENEERCIMPKEGREKYLNRDAIEYGVQGHYGPGSGERRGRSDSLGHGESMDGPGSYDAIPRGVYQQEGKPYGAIYRDGVGGVGYSKPGHEVKGLYPDAQKKGLTNGVVGNPGQGSGKGERVRFTPKSGAVKTGHETIPGGVYPAQAKGYKGVVETKAKKKKK